MSPAHARTSTADIVAASSELLEAGGPEAVTMQAVAARVGVKAPSLYKRFPDRAGLIAALLGAAYLDLAARLEPFASDPDPTAGMRAMALAYRAFGHERPRTYELMNLRLPEGAQPPPEVNARAAAPLLTLTQRLVGPERSLEAARLVTAFVHGFVSMELNGAFRLGGDVDAAYGYGVDVLVDALAGAPPVGRDGPSVAG